MPDEDHPWWPKLGKTLPSGDRVIAWGYANAEVDGEEYERLCILTMIANEDLLPGRANYSVYHWYPPSQVPPNTPPNIVMNHGFGYFEKSRSFQNIVPAVECYKDWGMDY